MTEVDNRIITKTGRGWGGARGSLVAIAIFALLAIVCAILSPGFVAADACVHYLFAKYAFADPVNWVDVWGRPLCTGLYAIPA
jgi:hypothetical protein